MRTIWMLLFLMISLNGLAQHVRPDTTHHPVYHYFLKGIDDFNHQKLESFLSQFDEDIHMFTHAGWLRSKQQAAARFTHLFKQFPNMRMQVDSLQVRQVNDHTVLVDFQCRTFPKGMGPAFHTVGTGVYVWRQGRWVEVLEHETLVKTDAGMFAD